MENIENNREKLSGNEIFYLTLKLNCNQRNFRMAETYFYEEEKVKFREMFHRLIELSREIGEPGDVRRTIRAVRTAINEGHYRRDKYGINPLMHAMSTSTTLADKLSPDRNMILAILLTPAVASNHISIEKLEEEWGDDIAKLAKGLIKITSLYSHRQAVESDNFRRLLMTFADDIRVIIIMIVDRLVLMHKINHHPNASFVQDVAYESNYLYAPLAHRLGLYAIKSELEDMSLKYTNREMYTSIAHKLAEKKAEREEYIANFIAPLKEKLQASGLKFDIKGRTKSIYSIWNKMQKQSNDIDKIYDLFAIRIIIDCEDDHKVEERDCWLAYSIVTDMYLPNLDRLKDWVTKPKSNGYESLHITVYGADSRWVEVQIRTRRMDLIAEKGLAAHWKYKGIQSENNLDAWMNNIRDILEAAKTGPFELIRNFKMDIYSKEVFVFTPKGDLYKLPLGSTIVDFAFHIHSNLGCKCTGAKVDGKNKKLNYVLQSGDTVEILTANNQQPKLDWLSFAITSKARNKIRQAVKEEEYRAAENAKELLLRRFKNRKIEVDESPLMKVIKKLGYKTVTDFYVAIYEEALDVNKVIDTYTTITEGETQEEEVVSAQEFTLIKKDDESSERERGKNNEVFEIGDGTVKGVKYTLSKCCNPIFGDEVFGFVSSEGSIKIHRNDCPNAQHLKSKFDYRIINVRWKGTDSSMESVVLRVTGRDDIGVVQQLSSIINKSKTAILRSVAINSLGGTFMGTLGILSTSSEALPKLIKKLGEVKGVYNITREGK